MWLLQGNRAPGSRTPAQHDQGREWSEISGVVHTIESQLRVRHVECWLLFLHSTDWLCSLRGRHSDGNHLANLQNLWNSTTRLWQWPASPVSWLYWKTWRPALMGRHWLKWVSQNRSLIGNLDPTFTDALSWAPLPHLGEVGAQRSHFWEVQWGAMTEERLLRSAIKEHVMKV